MGEFESALPRLPNVGYVAFLVRGHENLLMIDLRTAGAREKLIPRAEFGTKSGGRELGPHAPCLTGDPLHAHGGHPELDFIILCRAEGTLLLEEETDHRGSLEPPRGASHAIKS